MRGTPLLRLLNPTEKLMKHRVIVAGGRNWRDRERVETVLRRAYAALSQGLLFAADGVKAIPDQPMFVHGACPSGVDWIVRDYCLRMGWMQDPHPADWEKHGKAAGPMRNQRMVDRGAGLCLAFPTAESRGTWDCIRRAVAAGIETRIYPELKREPVA